VITVLTYGTFDLLHVGHTNLLKRARSLGDRLIVGLSVDAFCEEKGKTPIISYEDRKVILESLRFVDLVIPETCWSQKPRDVMTYDVDRFCMGDDWAGKFDDLSSLCEVIYLPRTKDISTSQLKEHLQRAGASTLSRV
jgi:glycerol-3-phosphate cytidylyltransferase